MHAWSHVHVCVLLLWQGAIIRIWTCSENSECSGRERERELHTEDQSSFLFLTTPLMSFPSIPLRIFINPSSPLLSLLSLCSSVTLFSPKMEAVDFRQHELIRIDIAATLRAMWGERREWKNRVDGKKVSYWLNSNPLFITLRKFKKWGFQHFCIKNGSQSYMYVRVIASEEMRTHRETYHPAVISLSFTELLAYFCSCLSLALMPRCGLRFFFFSCCCFQGCSCHICIHKLIGSLEDVS